MSAVGKAINSRVRVLGSGPKSIKSISLLGKIPSKQAFSMILSKEFPAVLFPDYMEIFGRNGDGGRGRIIL